MTKSTFKLLFSISINIVVASCRQDSVICDMNRQAFGVYQCYNEEKKNTEQFTLQHLDGAKISGYMERIPILTISDVDAVQFDIGEIASAPVSGLLFSIKNKSMMILKERLDVDVLAEFVITIDGKAVAKIGSQIFDEMLSSDGKMFIGLHSQGASDNLIKEVSERLNRQIRIK